MTGCSIVEVNPMLTSNSYPHLVFLLCISVLFILGRTLAAQRPSHLPVGSPSSPGINTRKRWTTCRGPTTCGRVRSSYMNVTTSMSDLNPVPAIRKNFLRLDLDICQKYVQTGSPFQMWSQSHLEAHFLAGSGTTGKTPALAPQSSNNSCKIMTIYTQNERKNKY